MFELPPHPNRKGGPCDYLEDEKRKDGQRLTERPEDFLPGFAPEVHLHNPPPPTKQPIEK